MRKGQGGVQGDTKRVREDILKEKVLIVFWARVVCMSRSLFYMRDDDIGMVSCCVRIGEREMHVLLDVCRSPDPTL